MLAVIVSTDDYVKVSAVATALDLRPDLRFQRKHMLCLPEAPQDGTNHHTVSSTVKDAMAEVEELDPQDEDGDALYMGIKSNPCTIDGRRVDVCIVYARMGSRTTCGAAFGSKEEVYTFLAVEAALHQLFPRKQHGGFVQ